ncbi:MAG: right-handed parallel beta-helix repeat-containing protein [Actinomycetota bacterium]|nr:right-handed parallel beta-helix repeat-containing protein [Actinomycetota bacterium]
MKGVRTTVVLGSALGLVFFGSAITPAGAATRVRCGATITATTKLAADVGPCPGDGVVVTANNITLDLNGHRVFGNAAPEAQGDFAGIRLQKTSRVVVKGGTVDHFAAGVVVQRGSSNTVQNLVVHDNIAPCEGEVNTQSPGLLGDGIVVFSSVGNQIQNNRAEHNGPFSGISLVAETNRTTGQIAGPVPKANLVRNNTVKDSTTCFGDMGIRVEGPGATQNVVQSNTVSGSLNEGIAVLSVLARDISGFGVTCSDPIADPSLPLCPAFVPPNPANTDNQILDNFSFENGQGPPVSGISLIAFPWANNPSGNLIKGNRAERNGGSGISVIGGDVVPSNLYGANNNTIVANTAVNNDTSGAPDRYDLIDDNTDRPCDHNQWAANVYETAFPACTTMGGTQVSTPGQAAPTASTAKATSTQPTTRAATRR